MGELYTIIQTLCISHGTNVSRMCLDLGMSKSVMSDLKAGKKKTLSANTLSKIASYFGVTVDYLLGNENKLADDDELAEELQILRDNPETRALLFVAKDMSPAQVKKLAEMMRAMKEG